MAAKSKYHSIGLIALLIVASAALLMVKPTDAQEIPKPAVPQFSIRYVDYSYDIPASSFTDAYTGKQIQHPSQHIGDIRVEGKIKNQPFTRYSVPNAPNGSISGMLTSTITFAIRDILVTIGLNIYGYHNTDYIRQNYDSEYTNFTIY